MFTTGPSGTALTNPQLIVRYDAATGREVGRVTLPPGEGLRAVSSDGRRLATFGGNVRGTLRLREFPSKRILVSVPGVRSGNVTFARGDEWVAAMDSTGRLGAWRTQNGQRMAESPTGRPACAARRTCSRASRPAACS